MGEGTQTGGVRLMCEERLTGGEKQMGVETLMGVESWLGEVTLEWPSWGDRG